ncbi:MAG: hypothetical protein ACK55I_07925, partial [bacterium]
FSGRQRLDLVNDEQRQFATLLGRHQRLVALERQVGVVVVLARQKLEAHAGPWIPAVGVKVDAVFAELHVPRHGIPPGLEQAGQQVTGPGLGNGVVHRVRLRRESSLRDCRDHT